MERKEVIKLFRELVKELGLDGVKIRLVPMKRKIASFSFKTKILRVNRKIVEVLDYELVRYIILHELIHFKIKDVNHGKRFFEEFGKYYTGDVRMLEIKLIQKLISSQIFEIIPFHLHHKSSTLREQHCSRGQYHENKACEPHHYYFKGIDKQGENKNSQCLLNRMPTPHVCVAGKQNSGGKMNQFQTARKF